MWIPNLWWYWKHFSWLLIALAYPWWVTPRQRWIIQSFVNTNPGLVFTKLITIIYRIGISIVSYANAQNNHKKFREYHTCHGIDNTSQDYSLHWHMHGGLCQRNLKGIVSLYLRPPVCLVRNQQYDNRQFLFSFVKQTNPNQSNRRSTVQWYFPL